MIEADSRDAVAASLARRGMLPLEIRLDQSGGRDRGRLTGADLALGLRMLATLLESGLSMSRALSAFDDLAPASWKRGLPSIREAVREGHSLSDALDASTLAVPSLVIGVIQAGEAGSGVAAAVQRVAEMMESVAATRSTIRQALAYPILLAVSGAASVAVLVGFVLPRFERILADLGQSLPASTRLVLALAGAAHASTLPALLASGVLFLAWRTWTRTESGHRRWHGLLLEVPVLGGVRRSAAAARAAAAMEALLGSAVPISSALVHAARAAGDAAIAAGMTAARESILKGGSIATSFAQQRCFPSASLRLIRAGEETGRLAEMFGHVAKLEKERAERAVRLAVRMLEPALVLVFAMIVALVAAALLQAVYSVRPVA